MKKRKSIALDNVQEFIALVLKRYDDDLQDRADWSDNRIQRYAKLYGWLKPKNYPWPNSSNQHIPMLMTNSQRTQDTLVNAVLATRPTVSAIAVNKGDSEKGRVVDQLQDYQFFVEQNGEEKIAFLADSFTNDGRFVCFVPWVKEKRKGREIRPLPPIPEGSDPLPVYNQLLEEVFPKGLVEQTDKEGVFKITTIAQYEGEEDDIATAECFTEDERHYMLITREKVIFDGPCPIPKPLEDIICPSRCDNLQPPGPSNPLGADHVIMVDFPHWDEIHRLADAGYYDLLEQDDLDAMQGRVDSQVGTNTTAAENEIEQHKILKDDLAGQTYGNVDTTSKIFTRLTYFGRYAVKENGFEDEIVARIILGPDRGIKALARLRYLEEEFPREDLSRPRPFASSPAFIPIPGQWFGMGLLELLEHMQDLTKILLDQMIDKHTLSNTPFFFYRSASGVRPETIRYEPGGMYPVSNPQNDVVPAQLPLQDQTIALNLITLVQQWSERQSMQGALQMGGVPQGKASALRTSTNMMSVLQQGDARPERILRRFFRGLCDVYQQMHELNKVFLPANKQYRISGIPPQGADPYQTVQSPQQIGGMFQFDFKANALNTSKAFKGQALSELLPFLVNGLSLQLGISNPETIYNLLHDLIESKGLEDHKYIKSPPGADQPKLTAEQAMGQILQGGMPQGIPAEGAQIHLTKLQQFAQNDPRINLLLQSDPNFVVILNAYIQQVQMQVQMEQQQAMAAQAFSEAMGGGGMTPQGGGPEGQVQPGADQMAPQGQGQVMDESLPGAKGMMG